ncbi:1-phosphofructokinase family hexose kinase [Rhizobium sp. C1]|uniref:1-phosphofructokinase family hexose kinase n=1 Tax=Rhizobium sp. C1 TaxID=1349799 RepID=UPI001E2E2269|nr:hexose kinase [Rhizobium sp. C1]MCD2177899.1 hexose kinase [Rhizobium sp. C1]
MTILAVALNPSVDVSSDAARVLPTRKVRTHNQRRHAGGGGVNVARGFAMLGGHPQLLIMVGGEVGALLMDALAGTAIDVATVRTAEPTRLAFMVYEEETGLEYRFVPDGPAVTSEEIEAAMDVVRDFKGAFLVLSGSLPRNAPDYTYARMAAVAASAGVKVVLDTSGKALLTTLKQAKLFLVKPSLSELETIAGKKLDERGIAETARQIVDEGWSEYVAVTLGRSGALLVGREISLRLPAIHVPVRSAVGAGDSFLAALVWKLEEGAPIEDAFRFGLAAGAAAALTPGTELCRREDVFAIYEGRLGASEKQPEALEP